jgi:Tfp pilus assembly protein PilN
MIKINLLGVAPPSSQTPSAGGPPAAKATQAIMFIGALIVCLGTVGIIYKVWTNQIADLEKKQQQEKIRQTELAVVKAQNDKYQQHLRDLETRINTIQALQNSRVGPVELMNSLGTIVSKTNDIYLYSLAPQGERVQLKGQSSSVESMTLFMAYLKNSGSYEDVQLEQFYQDDLHDKLAYKFSLNCQFKPSSGGPSPTAGGAPASPAGAAGPAGASSPAPAGVPAAAAAAAAQSKAGRIM